MLTLPIKYRPKKYSELQGQPTVVKFLQSLSKRQLGRNIILYGAYGTGKTTSARIYAKSLNCLNLSPDGDPCYICDACLEHSNVIEIDAASSSGKDDVKELLEIAKIPPLLGQYRVIIADEAQQFSKSAWDALLKSIEEPKSFQVFIFSTTEINKVREAIRSRCQNLEIKLLDTETSIRLLNKVCVAEGLTFEKDALEIISFISQGHSRDLLKNLEQVSYLGDISVNNTEIIFNLDYLKQLLSLVESLHNKDSISFFTELSVFAMTPEEIVENLRQFYLHLYHYIHCHGGSKVNPVFNLIPESDCREIWKQLCNIVPVEKITEFLSAISELKNNSIFTLEIALLALHKRLHVLNFKDPVQIAPLPVYPITGAGAPPPAGKESKGRVFLQNKPSPPLLENIPDYTPSAAKAVNYTSPGVVPPVVVDEKIYPHSLAKYGFTERTLSNDEELIQILK